MNNKTKYDIAYKKAHLKRVPLDMQLADYERLKAHCDSINKPVQTLIKELISKELEKAGK